ncbi:MAG: LPS export ABC transporter permease LptG [Azonexus sp.]|nr:LPS export ABC transporter permease LptG [Azonexus sp.]
MLRSRFLYQRYLQREVLGAIGIVLFAFLALFSFFDLIDELRHVGKADYGLLKAVSVVLFGLPGLLYELIPIACLIGALYALSNLARHSEITVLRASGLTTGQLLLGLLKLASWLALLTFLLGELVVPYTDRQAQDVKAFALNKVVAKQVYLSGFWVKDGKSFVNIRNVTSETSVEGIRIYRFDEGNALDYVLDAERAEFEQGLGWRMHGISQTTLAQDVATISHRDDEVWRTSVTPELLALLMVSPERMTLPNLVEYTGHLADNRQSTGRYEIALWKKIIYPLSALVMVTLALPFGYSHNRMGGASLKLFTGVMLGIGFYALNGLFSNLGVLNAWAPFVTAVAPSAIFLLAAGVLLWWAERR